MEIEQQRGNSTQKKCVKVDSNEGHPRKKQQNCCHGKNVKYPELEYTNLQENVHKMQTDGFSVSIEMTLFEDHRITDGMKILCSEFKRNYGWPGVYCVIWPCNLVIDIRGSAVPRQIPRQITCASKTCPQVIEDT